MEIKSYLCRKKKEMMRISVDTFKEIHRPMYIMEEARLRRNLSLIQSISREADVEFILAFKAFALWKTFPIFREYIQATTASSLYEAQLGKNIFGSPTHTYSPAYTAVEMPEIARCSSHLTFNSLSQYHRLASIARQANAAVSFGLRVNPEYSEVETMLYNPCAPGARFGILSSQLPDRLPADIEGFHCHCLCESGADVFARTLEHIEEKFGHWMDQLKWINFGGGHLVTRADYDHVLLIETLRQFHHRHPHLKIYLEPGSAFAWQTGPLVSQVVDIVENHGIQTAILNVSFTCHMPDCLEMPYWPRVRGARTIEGEEGLKAAVASGDLIAGPDGHPDFVSQHIYRLGGNSCLSGDYMGYWIFDHDLQIGENIILEDMIHYTTVKTNMFNGIGHPSLALAHVNGELELLREFTFDDYKNRMD